MQPDLVVAEPPARQTRPAEGVLACLDVLLAGAALVVEAHHPVGLNRQVRPGAPLGKMLPAGTETRASFAWQGLQAGIAGIDMAASDAHTKNIRKIFLFLLS